MKYGYHDKKAPLTKRLSRIEGQVRGISRMIDSDTYCIDILTQVSAAQAALDKVAMELLREHTRRCLNNEAVQSGGIDSKTDELVRAVSRLISR